MMHISYGSGRLKSFFTASLLLLVVSAVLTSCSMGSSGSGTSMTLAPTTAGNAGKNCNHVGVLLPDITSSTRWEQKDRPTLKNEIIKAIPGATVDEDNAGGDSANQLAQARADLSNGACILVVAPHDSVAAASIVELAKSQNVPVIAYDRLIQSKDLSYYVSFDNVQVGKLQVDYITK